MNVTILTVTYRVIIDTYLWKKAPTQSRVMALLFEKIVFTVIFFLRRGCMNFFRIFDSFWVRTGTNRMFIFQAPLCNRFFYRLHRVDFNSFSSEQNFLSKPIVLMECLQSGTVKFKFAGNQSALYGVHRQLFTSKGFFTGNNSFFIYQYKLLLMTYVNFKKKLSNKYCIKISKTTWCTLDQWNWMMRTQKNAA